MTALYIILGLGSVLFTSWVIWTLNTELSLYCWINGKKVFRGYFSNLGDLNEYIYKLEAFHGNSLTDWEIRTIQKKKFVKQVNDRLFASMLQTVIIKYNQEEATRLERLSIKMKECIDSTKQAIERTKQYLN